MIPQRDTFGTVTRRYLPLSGKRITFDSEIIETLYTSLRQIIIDHLEGFGRMAYSNLDDVDYLVEDNVMDEFAYHRRWKRPVVEWHIGGASWEQNANAGNDSGNWGRTQQ